MGRHRGHRGFRGFHPEESGGSEGFGRHGGIRGRKIGSDDLQLLLLLLLAERPSHGYELIRALEQRSAGFYAPSPGMVYPALTYLEELQYATVTSEGTRKLYLLAPAGQAYLQQHRAAAEAVMRQLEHFGRTMFGWSRHSAEAAAPPGTPPSGGSAAPHAPRHSLDLGASVNAVLSRLRPEAAQGELIYLLCRTLRATRAVEFASSIGVSTLYFAAALRDNGGGTVIGSELVPARLEAAQRNLTTAGLASWADLRLGDARQTLRDLGGPVDLALVDGRPGDDPHSLARQVVTVIAPQIRVGGLLMSDNAEPDYLEWVRDPRHGFVSITLPIQGATELSLKLG
jgi:predicted O-methyltransferase YrrM/DNA-binding PadR family transcriptional regulator